MSTRLLRPGPLPPPRRQRRRVLLRSLIIVSAVVAFAVPGVYSVATSAADAPPAPPASSSSPAVLLGSDVAPDPRLAGSVASPWPSASPADTTPPVTVATGADARWHRTAVTVRLTSTDDLSGVAGIYYRIDGGAWTKGAEVVVPAPKTHANDGQHVIVYSAVDFAGNVEADQSTTVRIDTTPPGFAWRDVTPTTIHHVQSVRFRFTIREPSGAVRLSWKATDQYGTQATSRAGLDRAPGSRELKVVPRYKNHQPFMPGLYRVTLRLVDEAGNVAVTTPRSFRDYHPAVAKVWRRVSGAGKRVALTFDDGGAGPWASMLNTLKAHNAHATFFPLGPYAAASPSLMRRTIAEGHAIGSHGWTHTAMTRQSYGAVRGEWTRSEAPWWSAADVTPVPYCRPPYGDYNGTTVAASGSAGFARVILWDVDPQDWMQPGSGVIAQRVLSHVHSGAIVCMHLLGQTAAALPAILNGLHARGYKAVSLPELFRAAGYR